MKSILTKTNNAFQTIQQQSGCVLNGSIPILWFGDLDAYALSEIKIVTVAINPSDKEFVGHNNVVCNSYRFPDYAGSIPSHITALNNYFKRNPYKTWFNPGFEPILNGMGASYYDDQNFAYRVLHTDICCPFATSPTWNRLKKKEQQKLNSVGFPLWQELMSVLKPDIILFSVRNEYIKPLPVSNVTLLCEFNKTKKDEPRKSPIDIQFGNYGGAFAVFGNTWNLPFGALGKKQKIELGRVILSRYKTQPRSSISQSTTPTEPIV